MSTRSGRIRQSVREASPPRLRKGVSPPRSPARTRKISPSAGATSPARGTRKSPARKSPSRKTSSKFPARKSPSRTTTKDETVIPKSPAKRPLIGSIEVKLEDYTAKIDSYRSTRNRRSDYTIKDVQVDSISDRFNGVGSAISNDLYGLRNRKPFEEVAPRRSSRLREYIDSIPDIRRSLSKSLSKSIDKSASKSLSKSMETYSDEESTEDEVQKQKLKAVTRKLATPIKESASERSKSIRNWEFGGRFGAAALIVLIPLTVFSILISCKKSCSLQNILDISTFRNLKFWFSLKAFGLITVQYTLQAIFALLPIFGSKVQQPEADVTYHFNALFSCFVTVTILFGAEFLNIISTADVLNEYLRLAVVNYLLSVILSIILFLRSRKLREDQLNPLGNTGYALHDFAVGREIQPYFMNLNLKIWTSRISNITSLVLAVIIFKQALIFPEIKEQNLSMENLKVIAGKLQWRPSVLLYSFLQIVYILNFIMKEIKIISTFYWQYEGAGYLQLAASALYPFYFFTISKNIADASLSLSQNILILSSILFLMGFIIMTWSNNIKYEFRKNPLQPNLTNLDSLPTFYGKKLLISHFWGLVRHPNYTGDILIHIALALPGIVSGKYIAALPALLTICVLLHRARRDHVRCGQRYGAAWQRYCRRVPSVVIPKIL